MVYTPTPPQVSKDITLEQAASNLQEAINHLHELRETIAQTPIGEVEESATMTDLWRKLSKIDFLALCDDGIPF